jgi:hypothetical protein
VRPSGGADTFEQEMLIETRKDALYKVCAVLAAAAGFALVSLGTAALADGSASALRLPAELGVVAQPGHPVVQLVRSARHAQTAATRRAEAEARHQPHTNPRATISLYEHTVRRLRLREQGCEAARRGVGGIVILDFGQPAYNGHTYGTYLFSGRFAGNKTITRAMFAYAYGYDRCLGRGSKLSITLARGTSNYHPQVPSAYKAGRKWARETMALQHALATHGLDDHVAPAAADDVEPAWDRSFHRTRDFYRGYRDAHTGHTIYNYGSLDGGVDGIWNASQVFFVTSGMRYAQSIPEIYNHAMAREWAELAHIAKHRYHRPLRFAGVMTTHTSANHGMKPREAHKTLVRALASRVGPSAASTVPTTLTNIVSAD